MQLDLRRTSWALVGWAILACGAVATRSAAEEPSAPRKREAWTTSRLAGSPDPPPPYRVEAAFPQLKFQRPLDITYSPEGERLFVVEQDGKVYSFPNDPAATRADLLTDLKQVHPDLTALYGLTFHPNYKRHRLVYLCYVKENDKPDESYVSRFEVSGTDPPVLDPASERVVIRWWSGGHNGGCLKFGPDGCLYISTGDGTSPSPPDALHTGQDTSDLLSSILRIDVDHPEGDRPYRVPQDNPLVGVAGSRPEIWAYGFRNPWRMSFDRQQGDLWVGDVGWQLWEMIYRVQRGGNYGWAVTEGPQPVMPEEKRGPTPILPPTVSHPHSEASSITGGFVYRGSRLSELAGVYIYGDFQTGKIWGLRCEGDQVTWHKELANSPLQLVAFGEDRAGELYLLDYERTGKIYRLSQNPAVGSVAAFPRLLSQTGLFASTADQSPAAGVVPYAINATHWADHTTSQRWMAIPGTDPVQVDADDNWKFPDGSVLAKTVGIHTQRGSPTSYRRLETQILHREAGSWRPYTYVWNEDQSDAALAEALGASRPLSIKDPAAAGGVRTQTYRFSSRAECQLCHNAWVEAKTTMYGVQTASPLAVNTPQLNRPASGGDSSRNQLDELRWRGLLVGQVPQNPAEAPRLADPYDTSADLSQRVRAYLHVNCAHCHQPHAGGTASIELMHYAQLDQANLLDVRPTQGTFGISDAKIVASGDPAGSVLHYRMAKIGSGRMPRVGSDEVDEQALAMIRQWITQLPRPHAAANGADEPDVECLAALSGESPEARAAAIGQLTASTRGALVLLQLVELGELSPESRQDVIALATEHPLAEVRDLFERFLPAEARVKRLGSVVDPTVLLAMPADAESGRRLFFKDGTATCKSCHRVNSQGETLGPDLSQIGKKYRKSEILAHLLEPSKLIEPKYVSYVLETADGRVLSGLLVEQNEQEVILRTAQNQQVRVSAAEVELLAPQQKSLMPELLLRDLTPQQAADLLAFLASLREPTGPN